MKNKSDPTNIHAQDAFKKRLAKLSKVFNLLEVYRENKTFPNIYAQQDDFEKRLEKLSKVFSFKSAAKLQKEIENSELDRTTKYILLRDLDRLEGIARWNSSM